MNIYKFLKGQNSRGLLLYIAGIITSGIAKEVTSSKVVITIAIIVVIKK